MAYYKGIVAVFVLCTLLATVIGQVSQEDLRGSHGHHGHHKGPHGSQENHHDNSQENQGRVRRQAEDTEAADDDLDMRYVKWTACDVKTTPLLSCQDCRSRLICKPVGGIQKRCDNPSKPYCNRGICSAVPSAGCA